VVVSWGSSRCGASLHSLYGPIHVCLSHFSLEVGNLQGPGLLLTVGTWVIVGTHCCTTVRTEIVVVHCYNGKYVIIVTNTNIIIGSTMTLYTIVAFVIPFKSTAFFRHGYQ
jgi:hypothetical protein